MMATTDPPSVSPENDVTPPPPPSPQTINGERYQILNFLLHKC